MGYCQFSNFCFKSPRKCPGWRRKLFGRGKCPGQFRCSHCSGKEMSYTDDGNELTWVRVGMVYNSRQFDRISPLLRDLHWLRVPERIKFRSAVLVFRCRNQTAPNYVARNLQWADTDDSQRRLRSATTQRLLVRRTRLYERSATAPLHRASGTICPPTSFLLCHWPYSSSAL